MWILQVEEANKDLEFQQQYTLGSMSTSSVKLSKLELNTSKEIFKSGQSFGAFLKLLLINKIPHKKFRFELSPICFEGKTTVAIQGCSVSTENSVVLNLLKQRYGDAAKIRSL